MAPTAQPRLMETVDPAWRRLRWVDALVSASDTGRSRLQDRPGEVPTVGQSLPATASRVS